MARANLRVQMESMELGYDDERFEATVNENFHCLICYNVLREPVMCRRSEHYFCRGCITKHLHTNSHTCPTCADELTVDTLKISRVVKKILDELIIRCDNYNRGCQERIQLQNLKQHEDECGFKLVLCGYQGCRATVNQRDRTYHENELCDFRRSKCHNCEEMSMTIAGVETKITNMNNKMTNVDTKTAKNETDLAEVKTQIANIDRKVKNIAAKMANFPTNVEAKMANMNTKMTRVDTKLANIQTNVDAKFKEVNNELEEMKQSLNEVKDGFDHLKEAVLDKMERKERNQKEVASDGRGKQHIFVAGGDERKSVEIFNYRQRIWSVLKSMESKRESATSFVYYNHVILAGGYCGSSVDNMIGMKVHSIPDPTINWSDCAAKLPDRMHGHSSVVHNDSLFVTGGWIEDQFVYSDCIHEGKLTPPHDVKLTAKMPEGRINHITALSDNSVLLFGGRKSGNYKDSLSSVLSYDIKKNELRQLPPLPYPVCEMASVKWGENVVIIGGADKDGKVLNNVIIYNIKTGNNHMLPPMLQKRAGCMAVVIDNTIVVLGGRNENGKSLKSVQGFSFNRYSWEKLPKMKETRWLATAVVI